MGRQLGQGESAKLSPCEKRMVLSGPGPGADVELKFRPISPNQRSYARPCSIQIEANHTLCLFALRPKKSNGLMAERVPDARSLKDRRIFLLKVFEGHEPNQHPIERRSDASAKPT